MPSDSLAATRVVSRVVNAFDLELPLKTLFDSPTVAEMAEVISEFQDKEQKKKDLETL